MRRCARTASRLVEEADGAAASADGSAEARELTSGCIRELLAEAEARPGIPAIIFGDANQELIVHFMNHELIDRWGSRLTWILLIDR